MKLLKILTLALTALILVPSGAHLFELPAKITLDRDDYFTVQQIYAGWALFGAPILGAIAANGALFLALRKRDPASASWALISCALIAISLTVFFIWVFPGNQATANWTRPTENWEALRTQWEYGHAANAFIVFAAFLATARAAIGKSVSVIPESGAARM